MTELLVQNPSLKGAPFETVHWIAHLRNAPREKPVVLSLDARRKEVTVVTFLDGKMISRLDVDERERNFSREAVAALEEVCQMYGLSDPHAVPVD